MSLTPRFDTMTEAGLRRFYENFIVGKSYINADEVSQVIDLLNDPSGLPKEESLGALEGRVLMILRDFGGYRWNIFNWRKSYVDYDGVGGPKVRIQPMQLNLVQRHKGASLDSEQLRAMINSSPDWRVYSLTFTEKTSVGIGVLIEVTRRVGPI